MSPYKLRWKNKSRKPGSCIRLCGIKDLEIIAQKNNDILYLCNLRNLRIKYYLWLRLKTSLGL